MLKLKLAAASLASVAVVALTPVAVYADACNQCYGGCIDAYGDDNSISGYYQLSVCIGQCRDDNGYLCQAGAPGG